MTMSRDKGKAPYSGEGASPGKCGAAADFDDCKSISGSRQTSLTPLNDKVPEADPTGKKFGVRLINSRTQPRRKRGRFTDIIDDLRCQLPLPQLIEQATGKRVHHGKRNKCPLPMHPQTHKDAFSLSLARGVKHRGRHYWKCSAGCEGERHKDELDFLQAFYGLDFDAALDQWERMANHHAQARNGGAA